MKCYYHQEIDAVGTCTDCGKAICQSCAVNVASRFFCQQCLASGTAIRGQPTESVPTNPLAIVSLLLGILGLLGCICGGSIGSILFGIPACITGWIARKQLMENDHSQKGVQLASMGLILGIAEVVIGILVILVFGSIYGIAFLNELL